MSALNFPKYDFKVKRLKSKLTIFDRTRRKFVVLTPEEWVRQHLIEFLVNEKGYPRSLIALEYALNYNGLQKRCDVLVFGADTRPLLIAECKASSVAISQDVFDQIARYNFVLNVPYLLVTNGINHYSCVADKSNTGFSFLREIPDFSYITNSENGQSTSH